MTDLITVSDYKQYKGIVKSDEDNRVEFIIKSVSTLVKQYCGHSFIDYYSTNKVETFNIYPAQKAVMLTEWPVNTISSVKTRTSYTGTLVELAASEYMLDAVSDTLYIHSGYWPEGYGSVEVTYRAGYSATPEDIKIACLDLVQHHFKEEWKARKSTGTTSIDNSSSNSGGPTRWPPHVIRVLDLYRNG